jgi:hypothetical protein
LDVRAGGNVGSVQDPRPTTRLLDVMDARTASILTWIDDGHARTGRLEATRAVIELQEAVAELRRRELGACTVAEQV